MIELIVSATILAVVGAVLVTLVPSAYLAVRNAQHRSHAGEVAQSLLEETRLERFTDLPAGPTDMGPVTRAGVTYQRRRTIAPVVGAGGAPLTETRRILVEVEWPERDGRRTVIRETVASAFPR